MKKAVKRVLVFAAVVVVLQSLALLFLTPRGCELIYPFFVRANAEKIRTEGNSYAAYYDMRLEMSEADLIVVGIDAGVPSSYDMLGHFTRFVKQYNNISAVMLPLEPVENNLVGFLFRQKDEESWIKFKNKLTDNTDMSDKQIAYISELYYINTTMSPLKKFGVVTYSPDEPRTEPLSTELIYDERTDAERISDKCEDAERSVLCAVDSKLLENGSSFREELSEEMRGKKIMYIQTHYTKSCAEGEGHTVYSFPFEPAEASVSIVENSSLSGFYRYYRFVTGLGRNGRSTENRLDERATDYFFVISGSAEENAEAAAADTAENTADEGGAL